MKTITKKWSELQIGDIFPDGSITTELTPWQLEVCYELKMQGKTIILSGSHLLKCHMIEENKVINNIFSISKKIREKTGESSEDWLCVKDIFTFWPLIEEYPNIYEVRMLNKEDKYNLLEEILLYKNGEPQKVRCISTSTGEYSINGFLNHNTGGKDLKSAKERNIVNNTFDAFITSPIIARAKEATTTESRRTAIYEGLKEQYEKNGIKMDDFNIKMIAKKMTSYKNDPVEGKRFVRKGECCDISSIGSIGNHSNPFKKAELQSSYKVLTTPGTYNIKSDAANEVIF